MKNSTQGKNHSNFTHTVMGSELAITAQEGEQRVMLEISIKMTLLLHIGIQKPNMMIGVTGR